MSRETKLGIVFVGILLFVFCALLVRKLTRPSNHGLNDLVAKSVDSSNDSAAIVRVTQAVPPTLVTPTNEISNPTARVNTADRSPTTTSTTPWTSSPSASSPAVLAAPIPIADLGDRYADHSPSRTNDSSPLESAGTVAAAQTYRSGYGSTSDNASTAVASTPATADPLVNRHAQDTAEHEPIAAVTSRTDWSNVKSSDNFKANDTITSTSLPSASMGSPRQADNAVPRQVGTGSRYSAAEQTDPFHRIAPQELQSYTAQVVAGTIADTPRSNPWERPTASPTASTQPIRYGAAVAPPVSMNSELNASASFAGISRDGDQYAVQPNDSYWTISEKAYGSGAFFKALHEHNRKKYKDADDLHVGQVLSVPDEGVLRRAYPDLCPKPRKTVASAQQRLVSASSRLRGPGRVYTVVDGDTLFEIARHELGKPARWGEIYELNREVLGEDFDYLRPGTELILPTNGEKNPQSETAVRQPESIYPR